MKLSFGKKLTASYLFVVAATLLFAAPILTHRLQQQFLRQLELSLAAQATLMGEAVSSSLAAASLEKLLQKPAETYGQRMGLRVTIIRRDGLVVGDSERKPAELARMDNHLSRPEVQRAMESGLGEAMRYSATLHENMLYVAVPVAPPGGTTPTGVLRVALPLTEVHRRIHQLYKDLLLAGAAAMFVALIVAFFSVRRTTRPLEHLIEMTREIGSGRKPTAWPEDRHDEFSRLALTLASMAAKIEEKVGELSRERSQLSAMLSALIEGVVALDQEGRLLFLNPAAERLFQVQSAAVRGRPFLEVLRYSPLNEVLQQTLSTREPVSREITLHSPEERLLNVQTIPVRYSEESIGLLVALHDVTELRKLERVRQEFVANASHELKTPLTSIKGFAETLLDGAIEDPKHNREFVQTILDHAQQLMRLIEDLLDLSAIEARRMSYTFEPVVLREIANRLLQSLEPMARAKKVSIKADLSDDLPKVRADREKLTQILLNLLDNAIKFNRDGGRVTLAATVDKTQMRISVTDTGRGIDPKDLPRVFERFFRTDKSHSHDIPGTGLGLAIVKHLVESHLGTVQARSTLGEGSVFEFTLPLA